MTGPRTVMIDYGGSNLRSVQKAFAAVGGEVQVTADPAIVRAARKLILPGVGAFGAGIAALRERGLAQVIVEQAESGKPLLGICLGMQLLFDASEEMGAHAGLGLLPGRVVRFNDNGATGARLKVPHMGWNQIDHDGRHWLLAGVPAGAYAYFVHSYYCRPGDATLTVAHTDYGAPFTSVAGRDNIYGIQFHPEKSQRVGLRILRNFIEH